MDTGTKFEAGVEVMRTRVIDKIVTYRQARQLTDGTPLTTELFHQMIIDMIGDIRCIKISGN